MKIISPGEWFGLTVTSTMLSVGISEKPLKCLRDLKPQQTPQPTSHGPASLNLLVKLMQECHSLQNNEKTCCGKTRWPTYSWAAQQIVHHQQTNPTPTALLIIE